MCSSSDRPLDSLTPVGCGRVLDGEVGVGGHLVDHRQQFIDRYAGQYILLQDNEVVWHDTQSELRRSRRELAGARKESAMWLKLVDPDEAEGEHFEVYERELARWS